MIQFYCSNCGHRFTVDDSSAGKQGNCSNCGVSQYAPSVAKTGTVVSAEAGLELTSTLILGLSLASMMITGLAIAFFAVSIIGRWLGLVAVIFGGIAVIVSRRRSGKFIWFAVSAICFSVFSTTVSNVLYRFSDAEPIHQEDSSIWQPFDTISMEAERTAAENSRLARLQSLRETHAQRFAETCVKGTLKTPSTAKFHLSVESPDRLFYYVRGDVTALNLFGVPITERLELCVGYLDFAEATAPKLYLFRMGDKYFELNGGLEAIARIKEQFRPALESREAGGD